jgi:hypothetical protein
MTFTTLIKVVKPLIPPLFFATLIRPLGKWLLGRLRERWEVNETTLRSCK